MLIRRTKRTRDDLEVVMCLTEAERKSLTRVGTPIQQRRFLEASVSKAIQLSRYISRG